ncbi:MAG: hypothetical protein PF450_14795 [Bacteroidales bacterium]|nr:hypothetical protein [Bacteroidales bacterium]
MVEEFGVGRLNLAVHCTFVPCTLVPLLEKAKWSRELFFPHLTNELIKEMSRLLKKQDLLKAELTKKYKLGRSVWNNICIMELGNKPGINLQ